MKSRPFMTPYYLIIGIIIVGWLLIWLIKDKTLKNELLRINTATGDSSKVQILLSIGADPNYSDGSSVLEKAAFMGHSQVLKLLIKNGATVNTRSQHGMTPLMDATLNSGSKDRIGTVVLLLDAGANVNDRDYSGNTTLSLAAIGCRSDIFSILVNHGADVNSRDSDGCTPLMHAARKCCLDSIRILLSHNADVTIKDNSGRTALMYAEMKSCSEIVKILEKAEQVVRKQ